MTAERIPIVLLTGFLGSGKTSLLKRMIHQPAFSQCAVIVNEFGEVGLDQVLVSESSDDRDVQLLDSGCLCCQASSAIQDTLASLYYRRLRGETPWFDRILIETSGLAEPGPIINSIYGDATISHHFVFAGIVTTFDTSFGRVNHDRYPEAKQQLLMADTIVLTKGDLVDKEEVDAGFAWLATVHPSARLLDNRLSDSELATRLLPTDRCNDTSYQSLSHHFPSPAHSSMEHTHQENIQSIAITVAHPVTWARWAAFVHGIQHTIAEHMLRLKGVLEFDGHGPMAVHGVHHLFSTPEAASQVPETLRGTLIFIVRDLSRKDIEQAVKPLLLTTTDS